MLSRELAFEYPKRGYFTMATRCEFYFLALLVDDVKDGFFFFFKLQLYVLLLKPSPHVSPLPPHPKILSRVFSKTLYFLIL